MVTNRKTGRAQLVETQNFSAFRRRFKTAEMKSASKKAEGIEVCTQQPMIIRWGRFAGLSARDFGL